jgi:hypothetical protein
MTNEEFSNEFDVLLSIYNSNGAIKALDEYEKSVFLTKAQEDIIEELYSGYNIKRDSFEKTEENRRYLHSLVKTHTCTYSVDSHLGVSSLSKFFKLPDDILFITYEYILSDDNSSDTEPILVVPVTQDEYYNVLNNPFRGPSNNRAIRLDIEDNTVEIISNLDINSYIIRYVSRPNPIILTELPIDLSINGKNQITSCDLNPALHRQILERAVRLALISQSYSADKK